MCCNQVLYFIKHNLVTLKMISLRRLLALRLCCRVLSSTASTKFGRNPHFNNNNNNNKYFVSFHQVRKLHKSRFADEFSKLHEQRNDADERKRENAKDAVELEDEKVEKLMPLLASELRRHSPIPTERWAKLQWKIEQADIDILTFKRFVVRRCIRNRNYECGKSFLVYCNSVVEEDKKPVVRDSLKMEILESFLVTHVNSNRDITAERWISIGGEIRSFHVVRNGLREDESFSDDVVDGYIMNHCLKHRLYYRAKLYLLHRRAIGCDVSVAALVTFMQLCGDCYDVAEPPTILDVYKQINEKSIVYNMETAGKVIAGLSLTNQWADCFKLLATNKISDVGYDVDVCNNLGFAAFRNNNAERGWKWLKKMDRKRLHLKTCMAVVLSIENSDKKMLQFFDFCASHELHLPEKCTDFLKVWFQKRFKYEAKYSTVNLSGTCSNCFQYLESNALSDDEFRSLHAHFVGKVERDDNQPQVNAFRTFLSHVSPYDVVIDALNVSYYQERMAWDSERAKQLYNVVEYFCQRKKSVVVIGRKHMQKWKKKYFDHIYRNAYCFFLDDSTTDDVYFLTAALQGGNNTVLVTADSMQDHLDSLEDEAMKKLFRRWQLRHQWILKNRYLTEDVEFLDCVKHKTSLQRTVHRIHVPCSTTQDADMCLEAPSKWLCIKSSLK